MFYYHFDERAESPLAPMQMNCVHYRSDAKAGETTKRIAFVHHNHETLELLAVLRGRVRITVEERSYTAEAGDVVVVNPFRLHFGEWPSDDALGEYVCVTLSLSKWLTFRKSHLFAEMTHLLEERYAFDEFLPRGEGDELFAAIQRIDACFQAKDAAGECLLAGEVYGLLGRLLNTHYHPVSAEQTSGRSLDFVVKASKYLSAHYAEDISTADIAAALYMPVQSFCYSFKKHFKTSFLIYLCRYRITRATELYREREMPLALLAEQVGFTDYSYFSRSFKRYLGESPATYFGKWRERERRENK